MSCHFIHLLQVSKKCLWSLILYNFLHDLIHVYSPGAGTESPQGTKFWCQQEGLITLPIVSKKSLWSLILYIFFHDLIHVYSPRAGAYSPQGTRFWCQQKLLVTSVICCQFQITDNNSFWKIHCFTFLPYKSIRDQIWPCRKICQAQPKVIIWANLVVLKHRKMHTKIQGHWLFGSGEEDFFRFLPYMAMAAILVMWPGPFEQTFVPSSHRSSTWNLTLIGPVVSEEKMFKECGGRQTTEAYLSCKLTIWAFGSGELKIRIKSCQQDISKCI